MVVFIMYKYKYAQVCILPFFGQTMHTHQSMCLPLSVMILEDFYMNQKDLRRLGRRELLEILLDLSKENEQLRERNSALEAQLQDRTLAISDVGSLAEAAMKLNGIFQAAQDACEQYIYNINLRSRQMEEDKNQEGMQSPITDEN